MKKEIRKVSVMMIICLLFAILFVSFTNAAANAELESPNSDLRVTLLTPSATFNVQQNSNFKYYITVENKNPFPVNIKIQKVKGVKFRDAVIFSLKPGKIKKVDFSYKATKNETLLIPVLFSSKYKSFGLQESINIYTIPKKPILNRFVTYISKIFPSDSN